MSFGRGARSKEGIDLPDETRFPQCASIVLYIL